MNSPVPPVFLAPGIDPEDFKEFHPALLRLGSKAPEFSVISSKMTEEAVRERVSELVSPRKGRGIPRKGLVPATRAYLKDSDASKFAEMGIRPEKEGELQAVASLLLDNGYPELACRLAVSVRESECRAEFLRRFAEVFLAACQQAVESSAEDSLLNELRRSTITLRDGMAVEASTGRDYYLLGRLDEMCVLSSGDTDIESAFMHYHEAVRLGETDAVLHLSELLFFSEMNEDGFSLLQSAWENFGEPRFVKELANRHFSQGNRAEGFRYTSIMSAAVMGKGRATPVPQADTLVLPSGLTLCQSFLFSRELTWGTGAYLDKGVSSMVRKWLTEEFEAVSLEASELETVPDSLYEDRLSILQFGAFELSDANFALMYLDEISFHLKREDGRDFLISYLEENASPYAKALTYRVEDESLASLWDFETIPSSSDARAEVSEGFEISERRYADLGHAVADQISFLRYRFSFFGDEEIMERIATIGDTIGDSDDQSAREAMAEAVASATADFSERAKTFDALSDRMRTWYSQLRKAIVEESGESYLRHLLVNAYYPKGMPSVLKTKEEIAFHVIESCFASGTGLPEEEAENLTQNFLDAGANDEEIGLLGEFLFECGMGIVTLDLSLAAKDVRHPLVFRNIVRTAVYFPQMRDEIGSDFFKALEEEGVEMGEECTLSDSAYAVAMANSDSPLARGNLAMAYHAFVDDPAILRKTALVVYDVAAKMGDEESGIMAARLLANDIGDFPAAEARMIEIFDSGDLRVVPDLCGLYFRMQNREAFVTFLKLAEREGLLGAEDHRVRSLMAGTREERFEAIRAFPAYSAPPKRGLSADVEQICRSLAMGEVVDVGEMTMTSFEHLFPKLVSARFLLRFPQAPESEKDAEELSKFLYSVASWYLDAIRKLLSHPTESLKTYEFFSGLTDLEYQVKLMADDRPQEPEEDGGEERKELDIVSASSYAFAEIAETMRLTSRFSDGELNSRIARLLHIIPGGTDFVDRILSKNTAGASGRKFH